MLNVRHYGATHRPGPLAAVKGDELLHFLLRGYDYGLR